MSDTIELNLSSDDFVEKLAGCKAGEKGKTVTVTFDVSSAHGQAPRLAEDDMPLTGGPGDAIMSKKKQPSKTLRLQGTITAIDAKGYKKAKEPKGDDETSGVGAAIMAKKKNAY